MDADVMMTLQSQQRPVLVGEFPAMRSWIRRRARARRACSSLAGAAEAAESGAGGGRGARLEAEGQ
jgi:hypothetical protein